MSRPSRHLNMAALTPERLASLKNYMRVDGDTDDALIEELYAANVEYLAGAGVYRTADNAARFDNTINSLTLYDYDHRNDINATAASMPQGARRVLNQLKLESQAAAAATEVSAWPK